MFVIVTRSLVSASQDGKLIVWDGYTTNKVCYNVIYNCYHDYITVRLHRAHRVQMAASCYRLYRGLSVRWT